MLQSDTLKTEDEHTVLGFIFHYTNLQRIRQGKEAALLSANLLTRCLRFNFLDLYYILSAIRKNESLQSA